MLATDTPVGLWLTPSDTIRSQTLEALANVRQFGTALRRLGAERPEALEMAGLPSAVDSRVFGWLARIPVPSALHRALEPLPRAVQARAVRYLLGHALLAAYHGALDYDP